MDVDNDTSPVIEDDDEADSDVSLTKVVLVPESELDSTYLFKSLFI